MLMTLCGAQSKGVLSGLGVGVGYWGREVGLGTQLSLQTAAPLGGWVGVHGPMARVPTLPLLGSFCFPGLEALHKKTAPGCSTYLMSMGQDGRAGLALAMLGGAYQRIQGWSIGEGVPALHSLC